MMKWAILLTLAGCSVSPPAEVVTPVEVKPCAPPLAIPPPPPQPRTVDSIVRAYNALKDIAVKNEAAQRECAARVNNY